MVEEIDLRPYLAALIRHWKWVVGTAVLVFTSLFILLSFSPQNYQSSALVVITTPQRTVLTSLTTEELEPRLASVNQNSQPLRAATEIAFSGEMMEQVLAQLTPPIEGITTSEDLQKRLSVETVGDMSVLYLRAKMLTPQDATRVANIWAELFVEQANKIYANLDSTQIDFLESELTDAEANLTEANTALIEFQGRNNTLIFTNQLEELSEMYAELVNRQQEIQQLAQNVQALQTMIVNRDQTFPAGAADQLTALGLQLKTFEAETSVPLMVDTSTLTTVDRETQKILLDGLLEALATQSGLMQTRLIDLEARILHLQEQKQANSVEETLLTSRHSLAMETYLALARKLEEERLTVSNAGNGIKLAGRAVTPIQPMSSNRLELSALGAGGMVFVVVALIGVWEWWRGGQTIR